MRFLASGAANTIITFVLYLVLMNWISYRLSYTIAFCMGIVLAYFFNRFYVFLKPGGQLAPLWVTLIYALQYAVGLGVVTVWVQWLGGAQQLAPLVAVTVSLPITFALNSFVFRRAENVPKRN